MKLYAYILLFIFSSNVLKAGSAIHMISSATFALFEMEQSCDEKSSCCAGDADSEEEDCCGGDNCQCTCCVHLVFLDVFGKKKTLNESPFAQIQDNYKFNYEFDLIRGTFHPPLFS